MEGEYILSGVPANAKITVSYIGYRTLYLKASDKGLSKIILAEDSEMLEEVVVTALGIKRSEKALGYSVQKVTSETLQKVAGVDVSTSLTGKVAGLLVKNSTDFAAAPTLAIRGENPLIVIDGVPYANMTMRDIVADDIESVSVLKGATASALYGNRGASGAVMITTKSGAENKEPISISLASNTMFSAGFLAIPEKQSMYGRGTNNKYDKDAGYLTGKTGNPIESFGFDETGIVNKNVLLIDDVITRGTTFNLTADKLKSLGAKNVTGLFLAHTINPDYSSCYEEPYNEEPDYDPYEEEETYERYNGSYAQDVEGWSDQDIDDVFDGDPDAYWNID